MSVGKGLRGGKQFINQKGADRFLDAIKTGKSRLGNSCPYVDSIVHFQPEFALANLEHSKQSQIVTGPVDTTSHVYSIFSDIRIYEFFLISGVSLSPDRR